MKNTPQEKVTVRSPIGGTVIEKSIVKGHFVEPDMMLYRITDLSQAWVIAEVYEYELGRISDGRLGDALGAGETGERAAVDDAAIAWMAWWQSRTRPQARDAWQPERLEHDASVRAAMPQGTVQLRSAEYPGGRIDWDDFVVEHVDAAASGAGTEQRVDAMPVPLDVLGMPVVRFWELEDPRFDPGRVSVGPGELGTALIVETALTYAADWFLIGVPVAVGALHRITSLQVVDTFGLAVP